MPRVRSVPRTVLAEVMAAARSSSRLRTNWNLHPTLDDPIQRFVNVFQPGTYVRPHRHEPGRFELFLVLGGSAAALTFHDDGRLDGVHLVNNNHNVAVEIAGAVWHTVVALVPDTVLFEVKPGPYRPLNDKDFAPWSPLEGEPAARQLVEVWQAAATAGLSGPTG